MATECAFTDKLSAELRVRIFRYLFGAGGNVKHALGVQDVGRINTSIFLVNKTISEESLECFFQVHTICCQPGLLIRLSLWLVNAKSADFVRNVEIIYQWQEAVMMNDKDALANTVRKLVSRPRLRSITISSDSLARSKLSVRQFICDAGLDSEVVYTDIGRCHLTGDLSRVSFRHNDITEVWPVVSANPADCEFFSVVRVLNMKEDERSSAKLRKAALRLWIHILDV